MILTHAVHLAGQNFVLPQFVKGHLAGLLVAGRFAADRSGGPVTAEGPLG
jgi:hypothetical protein